MDSKARLAGHAKQMFLEHYVIRRLTSSNLPFLRFMYSSKSGRQAIQKYFHGMTLSLNSHDWCFTPERSDVFFKDTYLKDSLAVHILDFLKPYIAKVVVSSDIRPERLDTLKAYVDGVTKLHLDMADTNAILFVQHAAPKITELTCPIEALMLSNFPVMNLNKFIVRSNIFHEQLEIAPLFQYNIKEVDLTDVINPDVFENAAFGSDEYRNTAIERLSLKVINSKLNEKILPFVKKFLEHAPNLQTLDLTVEATSSYLDGKDFVNELIRIYNEIVSFKEQTQSFLKKLFVKFSGNTFVMDTDGYNTNWTDVLLVREPFKDAKFSTNQWDNEEIVEFDEYKNNGHSIFSLSFKAAFSIVDEDEYQQAINDNLDFDDLDLEDEGEINYDYSDVSDFDM